MLLNFYILLSIIPIFYRFNGIFAYPPDDQIASTTELNDTSFGQFKNKNY